jgi:cytochrome P450
MPGQPLLGSLRALQRDPFAVLTEATLSFSPWVRLKVPGSDIYVPGDAAVFEHILVTNVRNFDKQLRSYQMLRNIVGVGLVTSDGDFWKRQRRTAQPAFHRERIAAFGEVMSRASSEMVDAFVLGKPFDVAAAFNHVALKLVGETILSNDVTTSASRVEPAMRVALEHLVRRSLDPLSAPEWVPTRKNRAFRAAIEELDRVVNGVIANRRAGKDTRNDLLAMLMEARDPETGEGMTDTQLRDEVMTIFLAGHETTATALSWTAMLIAQHPDVEARLVEELTQVLGGRRPGMQDVAKLTYTGMILKESMRLYPPVWSLGRRVVEDEVVAGVLLKKNTQIFLCPYAIQRHPKYWKDPERFDPSRWASDAPTPTKGTYLPFNIGQRKCIGDVFATVEAQIILATLYQRVHLTLVPDRPVRQEALLTLRPADGVWVTASPR